MGVGPRGRSIDCGFARYDRERVGPRQQMGRLTLDKGRVLGLLVAGWNVLPVSSSSVTWQSDSISISITGSAPELRNFTLDLQASRSVLPSTFGHFKLSVTREDISYNTSCIPYGASASTVSEALGNIDSMAGLGGALVVRQGNGSSAYSYGYTYLVSAVNSTLNLGAYVGFEVAGSGLQHGCSRVSTLGLWDDEVNWDTGVVPGPTDEVTIPADSSYIALTQDTEVSTLSMSGGALVTHDTTCLPGWTSAPGGTATSFGASKCYKLFSEPLLWGEAQSACASAVSRQEAGLRGGALRGALVTIQGLEENQWVGRLCRGDPLNRDCWIGMSRSPNVQGYEQMEWDDLEVLVGESRYRSWTRNEPNNLHDEEGGQNCVAMHASKNRALDQGEARWHDAECASDKPFVCQAFGVSIPYTLTVTTEFDMLGGYIMGAGTVQSSTFAQVTGDEGEVGILRGATLVNSASGSIEWSAPLTVGWGGTLRNKGILTFMDSLYLSAAEDAEGFGTSDVGVGEEVIWPLVLNEEGGEFIVGEGAEVDLEWLLWNQGGTVSVAGALDVSGAGYSSFGNITIEASGEARFSNSSFLMHQTEAVAITLAADREVTGQDVEDSSQKAGYYRLAFGGEETSCIGYHASEINVQAALEELVSVQEVGGVDVRRDGNGKLKTWQYGYRHVVTFDGARDLLSSTLTLSCAGSMTTCGCVDVTGAIAGPESSGVGCGTAIFEFQNTSTSAQFKPSDCLVQATVTLEAIREGGETMVSGGGVAVFSNGGQYVLSSIVEAHVKVESAAEVICAEWSTELVGGVNVTSGGVLWIAGGDWDALDAVRLLHAPPDTFGRTGTAISSPPSFHSFISGDVTVEIDGEMRLASASPAASTITIAGSLALSGGNLSGKGRIVVQDSTVIASTLESNADGTVNEEDASSLRNGVTLYMSGGGEWSGGSVYARDGAQVVNMGLFNVTADGAAIFGAGGNFGAKARLDFDGVAWYPNPLCGDSCMLEPTWNNSIGGVVVGSAGSDARLAFILQNEGTVRVEDKGLLDWCGAGEGKGAGNIHLPDANSTLRISNGKFILAPTANVSGSGVMQFSGGRGHELAREIAPLVLVSGGARVVVVASELLLGKGLKVMEHAMINFSAINSSINISGDLTLRDFGTIIFPAPTVENNLLPPFGVGVSPPWGDREGDLDGSNGWGGASRCSVLVQGTFTWMGGTFAGNARVVSAGDSEWHQSTTEAPSSVSTASTATKRLLDSFHLINDGDTVWSKGDVVVSTGAAFVNRGTLRLLETAAGATSDTETDDSSSSESSYNAPRIRGPRKGEHFCTDSDDSFWGAESAGGAGSVGGGAADWA